MPFLAQKTYPIPEQDLLSWTFDNLTYDQDEPIYIDGLNPSNSISARQARKLIRQLVAGFHAIGLKRGDCVCIHSFNDICYPIFFLGIIAAGGVFAGTNPAYTPYELAHTLKTTKAKYVLVQPDLLDPVLAGIKDTAITEDKVIIFNPNQEATPSGFLQWSDLLKHGEQDWVTLSGQASKDTTAALLFSSGTTGLPKAAMLSHYNFIAQHTLVFEATTRPWRARRLLPLPMFHAATAPVAHTSPLRAGEPAYVLPRFEPETWWQALEKYEITDLLVVPPLVVLAVNSPLRHKYSLKAVRAGYVGAAPLDKALQARMQALLSEGVTLTQVWGMTETSCICTMFAYPDADVTGSVGYPLPGVDAKLVDDDGKDISGYDVRGELCVRGPNVIRGYFENPEANARDFDSDGFFHTGDIAFCDGKTKLWYIVDRKKELIKVRAFQVAPPELEGVLLDHPDIVDCAVIGVVDAAREGSELPRAYIVRRDAKSEKPSVNEVHEYMRTRLASYKQLEGGVLFVDAVPKNQSGKILKRILREQAKREMGAKL